MFNRGSRIDRRNANNMTPPPCNRGPWELRRNAISAPPLPYFGATTSSQKCQLLLAPMGRVTMTMQQCRLAVTLPNQSTGGQKRPAEMPPIIHPRLTTGSHPNDAAMLFINRSRFIWCRSTLAEMPLYWRTNNQRPAKLRRNATTPSPRIKQGDPLWINVTKTQPLPRYI
jgi:hypothetical protein